MFVAMEILLFVRNWASWCDGPFSVGNAKKKMDLILHYLQKISPNVIIETFRVLVAKITVRDELYVVYNEVSNFIQ
jgi:hypothetical protein